MSMSKTLTELPPSDSSHTNIKSNSKGLPRLHKAPSRLPGMEWTLAKFSFPSFLCLICSLPCKPSCFLFHMGAGP